MKDFLKNKFAMLAIGTAGLFAGSCGVSQNMAQKEPQQHIIPLDIVHKSVDGDAVTITAMGGNVATFICKNDTAYFEDGSKMALSEQPSLKNYVDGLREGNGKDLKARYVEFDIK